MKFNKLKKQGYKIVTNWQECNKKSIFLFDNTNYIKFINYEKLAIKKNCKYIICNIKFKKKIKDTSIIYFFYNLS